MIVRHVPEHVVIEGEEDVERFSFELLRSADESFLRVDGDEITITARDRVLRYRIVAWESPGTLVAERASDGPSA